MFLMNGVEVKIFIILGFLYNNCFCGYFDLIGNRNYVFIVILFILFMEIYDNL